MNTVPTRHHTPGQSGLAIGSVAVMTVLFLLFERSIVWLAALLAIVALLPLAGNDWTARQIYTRTAVAGLVLVAGIVIWLT